MDAACPSSFRFGAERWCFTTALHVAASEKLERVRALRHSSGGRGLTGEQRSVKTVTPGVCGGQLPCVLQH